MHPYDSVLYSHQRAKSFRSFREYGENVLKHLENSIGSDPNLQKAPVNYEGVCLQFYISTFYACLIN